MSRYGQIAIVDVSPAGFSYFAKNVGALLDKKVIHVNRDEFPDGELNIVIPQSCRGKDTFLFQCYQPKPRERWDDLNYTLSAVISSGSVGRVNVVMPYCFGQRGERQTEPRQSVPIELVVRDLYGKSVDNVVVACLHTEVISTIFRVTGERKGIRAESLKFEPLAANYIGNTSIERGYDRISMVSPDAGGSKRVETTFDMVVNAFSVDVDVAQGYKVRKKGEPEVKKMMGDVTGKMAFVIDDIGDTHKSIKGNVRLLKELGAKGMHLLLAHPVQGKGFESQLEEMLKDDFVIEVVYGNTMPMKQGIAEHPKIRQIPFEPFIARAIMNMNEDRQMSDLHEYKEIVGLYEESSQKYELSARLTLPAQIVDKQVRIRKIKEN